MLCADQGRIVPSALRNFNFVSTTSNRQSDDRLGSFLILNIYLLSLLYRARGVQQIRSERV